MSVLDILKNIKLPSFGDDFIQNPAEKSIDSAPACNVKHKHHRFEVDAEVDIDSWDARCRAMQRHHDPSDPTSLSSLDIWEDT